MAFQRIQRTREQALDDKPVEARHQQGNARIPYHQFTFFRSNFVHGFSRS
jgi:hypothetical protein